MTRINAPEFRQWAFSDFLSNALRGVLAECIVATALDCTQKPRIEWDAYDLVTEDGLRVEVKSSAYLQTWPQKRPSAIRFDIGPKKSWDSETYASSSEALRPADVYVFCVFAATDRITADPLDLDQWFFLVCPTTVLDEKCGAQKSIGLASLERFGLERVSFEKLAATIRSVAVDR